MSDELTMVDVGGRVGNVQKLTLTPGPRCKNRNPTPTGPKTCGAQTSIVTVMGGDPIKWKTPKYTVCPTCDRKGEWVEEKNE